jgi:hypothetical protein
MSPSPEPREQHRDLPDWRQEAAPVEQLERLGMSAPSPESLECEMPAPSAHHEKNQEQAAPADTELPEDDEFEPDEPDTIHWTDEQFRSALPPADDIPAHLRNLPPRSLYRALEEARKGMWQKRFGKIE